MTHDQSLKLSVSPCFASTTPKVNVSITTEHSDRGGQTFIEGGVFSKAWKYTKLVSQDWLSGGQHYHGIRHIISPNCSL